MRRLGGLGLRALILIYFVAGAGLLVLRYGVLPDAVRWRDDIARHAAAALGVPVSIGALEADWSGLRPRLHLKQVTLSDASGAPALSLRQVDATLAWTSLLTLKPYFHRLEVHAPALQLARAADGTLSAAGIALTGDGDGGTLDWLLAQREIVIRGARVTWTDAQRAAPPLTLDAVNLRLVRRFGRHLAGLTAQAPADIARTVDLRAELRIAEGDPPSQWSGRLYARVHRGVLEALAPWVDLPGELSGRGDAALWATLSVGRLVGARADLALRDAHVRLAPDLPALALRRISGRIGGSRLARHLTLTSQALSLETADAVALAPIDMRLDVKGEGPAQRGEFTINTLDLASLAALAAHLPFDAAHRARLAALAPSGHFRDVAIGWSGPGEAPTQWRLRAAFERLGLIAHAGLPGLAGASGTIEGSEAGGRYRLESRDLALTLPGVFEAPLAFDTFSAQGGWQRRAGHWQIDLDSAQFANPDTHGEASGFYRPDPAGPGTIDLQARLVESDGTAVWRYLPLVINAHTRDWLKRSIVRGTAHDARLRLRGDLADFPFADGSGIFLITTRVSNARLDYAPSWPKIEGIEAALRFEGEGMQVTASRGTISGVELHDVRGEIPVLDSPDAQMTIAGTARGATADFLRFVSASPVRERINGFTDDMRARGNGELTLTLALPLNHIVDSTVDGHFRFADNSLSLVTGLPPIENAAGGVDFSEAELRIPAARGTLFGAPLQLSARTLDTGTVLFEASGKAQASALRAAYASPLLAHVSGETPWSARIEVRGAQTRVNVDAPLTGLASSLPAPFNKRAADSVPAEVALRLDAGVPARVQASLGGRARAELSVPRGRDGMARAAGGIGVGVAPPAAGQGVRVAIRQPALDVDAWRRALRSGAADEDAPSAAALPLAGLALDVDELAAYGETLHAVKLRAERAGEGWTARVDATEAVGTVRWQDAGEGAVQARFERLLLGRAKAANAPKPAPAQLASLPALDVVAERFGLHGRALGRLELQAFNRDGLWHMNRLAITNPDGALTGSGTWQPVAPAHTDLAFTLTSGNVGDLLARLGYPDTVHRGEATLTGKLGWHGAPTDIDYPSLAGAMELTAAGGQFRKLEPGVGRLLGVLSLQSLPRRISLDFRDVFSEGFAFDRISGSIDVDRGVMRTDPLEIRGPAARVLMRGTASVPDETQDLIVTVQPTLSESVAVGAAAGALNPVAGVVTYLVQKALADPLEKLFSFEYAVTGPWRAPKVEKLGKTPPAAPAESSTQGQ